MAKILIVDDEPRIRDLIRAHLEHEGFSCEEAGDGGAALAALSGGDVDLAGGTEGQGAGGAVHQPEPVFHGGDRGQGGGDYPPPPAPYPP